MPVEGTLQDLEVIERHNRDQVDDRLRRTAAVGDRHRGVGRTHQVGWGLDRHEQGIVVAVVAGLDLDQSIASGEAARQPNRIERRFGAAVRESPLRLPEPARQLLGDDGVVDHRLGEVRPFCGPFADRLYDLRMRMADDHHAEAIVKVDVLVPVDVPHTAALAVIDEDRLGRGVLEGRGNPARDELLGLLPELIGPLPLGPELILLLGDQFGDAAGGDRLGNSTHGFPPRDCFTASAEIASSMHRLAFWAVISA